MDRHRTLRILGRHAEWRANLVEQIAHRVFVADAALAARILDLEGPALAVPVESAWMPIG
jgi:hypothetical protein